MEKKHVLALIAIIISCIFFKSSAEAKEEITIKEASINARSGPGKDYKIVDKLKKGETFEVVKRENDWIKIKVNKKKSAWVASWLVTEENSNRTESNGSGIVTTDHLKLRDGPSTSTKILTLLSKGDIVDILKTEEDWLHINVNGQTGWVHSSYIDRDKSTVEEKGKKLKPPYAEVTATSLIVRNKPLSNSKNIATVKKGQTYKILREKNHWYQIKLSDKKHGWIPKWYTISVLKEKDTIENNSKVKILYDNVPLREAASPQSKIIKSADKADEFTVKSIKNDMYEVKLSWGKEAYVAGWMVKAENTPQIHKKGHQYQFENKTIVIDPGHGGNDSGTIGTNGTLEKELTGFTANLLKKKLEASGANVIVTRDKDNYLSLSSRVRIAHVHRADAFISLHYDSAEQNNIKGVTPYYYHKFQQPLALAINTSVESQEDIKVRDARFGDYHVLRHNSGPAVLLELGYLSNPEEEMLVTSLEYQTKIVSAIYEGLGTYFSK